MKLGWAKIINKYIGTPYNFGLYDCYTFICGVLEDQGYIIDYKQKIDVFDKTNYMDIHRQIRPPEPPGFFPAKNIVDILIVQIGLYGGIGLEILFLEQQFDS